MSPASFFARELAPSRRRIIEAARTATKATVTTGLAATMQISGPFGPLFAFRIGQPGISLGIFEGALAISCAAVMQAAIVPITGRLLDYPGLIMAFLFIVFATLGYLLSNTRLFLILALVAVGTITTVYVGIFKPDSIGWGSTYTFDGILVATLVMVVIDTFIWPSPPEPRLLESLATDFESTRRRLWLVGQRYLDPSAVSLPSARVRSMLAGNLTLLNLVKEHTKPTSRRLAALLDAVTTAERAYLEVEHLAVLAEQPASDGITPNHREEIAIALNALDTALAQRTNNILAALPDEENSTRWVSDFGGAIKHLKELSGQKLPARDQSAGAEGSNFLEFVGGLETIANVLEPHEQPLGSATAEPAEAEDDPEPRPFLDPARFRFSVKLGAAITLGLLVGLTTQRADIQTILWSIAVVGQPNQYGAVVRKTLLRLAGCLMGGLAALAAMIFVSENFDSLPAYVVVMFAVTIVATYVAQSDEWLGYAGIQTGITFLICYVGLGPTTDVYKPLWRFWGIVLGILTAAFVFLILWPEYASDKLIKALDKLIRTTLAFGREVAERPITEGRITAVERHVSANLLEVLEMADQARLEGRRGATNSAAAIEAASIVVRIAYRFEIIARGRIAGSPALQPQKILDHQATFEQACCAALEIQLAKLGTGDSSEDLAESSAVSIRDLAAMAGDLAAIESKQSSTESRILVATELESYRRLAILLQKLDTSLSRIAASQPNAGFSGHQD